MKISTLHKNGKAHFNFELDDITDQKDLPLVVTWGSGTFIRQANTTNYIEATDPNNNFKAYNPKELRKALEAGPVRDLPFMY